MKITVSVVMFQMTHQLMVVIGSVCKVPFPLSFKDGNVFRGATSWEINHFPVLRTGTEIAGVTFLYGGGIWNVPWDLDHPPMHARYLN